MPDLVPLLAYGVVRRAIDVHVVADRDSLVGPILIAVGAVVAALITVRTANWRHRQQLDHDRELRERDQIRDTIDMAVTGTTDAVDAVGTYASEVSALAKAETQLEKANDQDLEEAQDWLEKQAEETSEAMEAAHQTTGSMYATNVRLELRLSPDHPIVRHHNITRERLTEWGAALAPTDEPSSEAVENSRDARMYAVRDAFADFRAACRAWFRAQPSE